MLSILRKEPNYAEDEQDKVADAGYQPAEGDAHVRLRLAI